MLDDSVSAQPSHKTTADRVNQRAVVTSTVTSRLRFVCLVLSVCQLHIPWKYITEAKDALTAVLQSSAPLKLVPDTWETVFPFAVHGRLC